MSQGRKDFRREAEQVEPEGVSDGVRLPGRKERDI